MCGNHSNSNVIHAHAPPCGKVSPVNTVTARPVQIGAHHHIDVYTDIKKETTKTGCSLLLELCEHSRTASERPPKI